MVLFVVFIVAVAFAFLAINPSCLTASTICISGNKKRRTDLIENFIVFFLSIALVFTVFSAIANQQYLPLLYPRTDIRRGGYGQLPF